MGVYLEYVKRNRCKWGKKRRGHTTAKKYFEGGAVTFEKRSDEKDLRAKVRY
jgi:hypothetical protein